MEDVFNFKQFSIIQDQRLMRVNTDGVLLGAWANIETASRVLDIGSGTGVIGLMIAQRNPLAMIDCIEIDNHASKLSERNFKASMWNTRLSQINGKFPNDISDELKYDYMISNPPFFMDSTLSSDTHQIASRHSIHLSQIDLIQGVLKFLKKAGRFGLILPVRESELFEDTASRNGLFCFRKTFVRPNPNKKIERVLMEFSKKAIIRVEDELIIRIAEPNQYTADYKKLTQAFYLNF